MQAMPKNGLDGLPEYHLGMEKGGADGEEAGDSQPCVSCDKSATQTCACKGVHFCDKHAEKHMKNCKKGMVLFSAQQAVAQAITCPNDPGGCNEGV